MSINKKINNKVSLIAYGIAVPHYCYHNDLSIAGNCKVVSYVTNAQTALHNNNVYHGSALIKKARKNILITIMSIELLLLAVNLNFAVFSLYILN